MKRKDVLALGLITLGFASVASVLAADTFSGEVSDDLYFPNGVTFEGAQLPSNEDPIASSTYRLEGTGSVTVGDQAGGGFPRISIVGGTTITSTRDWSGQSTRTWWEGLLEAPSKTLKPSSNEIGEVPFGQSVRVVEAFQFGLDNEIFSYQPQARVALPVQASDGQKLYVALQSGGAWGLQEQICLVQDGICVIEVGRLNSIALIAFEYDSCPMTNVSNGSVGSAPGCVVSCNPNYMLNCFGTQCVPVDCVGSECACDASAAGGGSAGVDPGINAQVQEYLNAVESVKALEVKPGYFIYRGTNVDRRHMLPEEGLSGDDLEKVREINKGAISRGYHRPEDYDGTTALSDGPENSDFLDYILAVRAQFGEGQQSNDFRSSPTDEVIVDTHQAASSGEQYRGPMLPSTGPSVFILIAVIGLALMILGSMRRH